MILRHNDDNMDSRQIDHIIRRHVREFDGAYSRDTLLRHDRPKLLVANTDPADRPGQHWIAMSIDRRGNGQYFDSLGHLHRRILNSTSTDIANVGRILESSFKVLLVNYVDTIVSYGACLRVEK